MALEDIFRQFSRTTYKTSHHWTSHHKTFHHWTSLSLNILWMVNFCLCGLWIWIRLRNIGPDPQTTTLPTGIIFVFILLFYTAGGISRYQPDGSGSSGGLTRLAWQTSGHCALWILLQVDMFVREYIIIVSL